MPVFDRTKLVPSFWANLFLVQSWFPDKNFFACFNGPAWTLSVDAFLYLLLPIILALCVRKWWLLALSFFLCLSSSVAAFLLIPNSMEWALVIFPLTRIFDFSLGVLAYRFTKSSQFSNLEKKATTFDLCILAFAIAIAIVYAILTTYFLNASSAKSTLTSFLIVKFVYHILPALGLTALILSLCSTKGFLAKVFAWKPLVTFSALSCSLYLIHFPLIVAFRILTANLRPVFSPLLYGEIFVFIIACATLMFLVFEKPTRTLLNQLFDLFFQKHFPGQTRVRGSSEKIWRGSFWGNSGKFPNSAFGSLVVAVIFFALIKSTVLSLTIPELNAEEISEQSAAALSAGSLRSPANVIFNKRLTLLSVKLAVAGSHLKIQTLWRASVGARACKLAVHLLNDNNEIIAQAEDKLLAIPPEKTLLWKVDSEIDNIKTGDLKKIGLAVVAEGQTMYAECSPKCLTDWGGHRLIIKPGLF